MAKCQFNGEGGCLNEGTHYPILRLPPPRPHSKRSAASSAMPLPTCQACKAKVTIANFMIPEARAKIASGFIMAGKLVPDFDRAWLEWGEVGDEFWQETNRMMEQTPAQRPH